MLTLKTLSTMKRLLNRFERSSVEEVRSNSKFFECEITIRLFGRVVWHMVFPPNSNSNIEENED